MLIHLVAHPATPASILAPVLERTVAHPWQHPDPIAAAAAGNPNLPADLARQLLVTDSDSLWTPLMLRPGMTVQAATDLLGSTTHPRPLSAAIRGVRDPDDILVHLALDRTSHIEVAGTALACASTPSGAYRAALALAGQPLRNEFHVRSLRRYLMTRPCAWNELAAHTADDAIRADIQAWLAEADPVPGTIAWCARVSVADRLAFATAGGPGPFIQVLTNGPDPDHALARAALAAHPDDFAVAAAVLQARDLPEDLLIAAGTTLVSGEWRDAKNAAKTKTRLLVAGGPRAIVDAFLPRTYRVADLTQVLTRTDLTPAHLDAIADLGRTDASAARRVLGLASLTALGVWLATYPTATPEHVRTGVGFVRQTCATIAGDGDRLRGMGSVMPDLAEALRAFTEYLLRLPDADRTDVAWHMPVTVATHPALRDLPGVQSLVAGALDRALTPGLPTAAGVLLATLAPTFSGTVGELLDTVTAVTAAAA